MLMVIKRSHIAGKRQVKNFLPVFIILLLGFFVFDSCKSSASANKGGSSTKTAKAPKPKKVKKNAAIADSFDAIKSQNWLLTQVQVGAGQIILNRQEMANNNLGDVYTMQITAEGLSGKAAPNRYFAPFASNGAGGDLHTFTLQPIVDTKMMSDINVGGLMEPSYYWYLQRASRWQVSGQSLYLYAQSRNDPSQQIVMVYEPGPSMLQ